MKKFKIKAKTTQGGTFIEDIASINFLDACAALQRANSDVTFRSFKMISETPAETLDAVLLEKTRNLLICLARKGHAIECKAILRNLGSCAITLKQVVSNKELEDVYFALEGVRVSNRIML